MRPLTEPTSPAVTKVIFVNRYFYPDHSATSQLLSDLAFGLDAGGSYQIHVVTSRQRYDDPMAQLPAFEEVKGVHVHRVWTSRFGRRHLPGRALDYLSFYLTAFLKLLQLTDAGSVVVAKTDPPLVSVMAAMAVKLRSARLVNWIQDLFPEVAGALGVRLAGGPAFHLLRWLRNLSVRGASKNVAIGQSMRDRIVAEGAPSGSVEIIHNWADGRQICPIDTADNALRKEWGLAGKFVIGYSGNLGRAHEHQPILEAATRLQNRSEIAFLIIGGGINRDGFQDEVQARALTNVIFKPYQARERLAESLSVADVHLISLRPTLEGLIVPSKFYGIAAAARPSIFIGSSNGEIARLIRLHDCGTVMVEDQPATLADQILWYCDHPAERQRQGTNALTAFKEHYDKAIQIARFEQCLRAASA